MAKDDKPNELFTKLIGEVKSGKAEARIAEKKKITNMKKAQGSTTKAMKTLEKEIVKQGGVPKENKKYLKAQNEITKRSLKIEQAELKLRRKNVPYFSELEKFKDESIKRESKIIWQQFI